MSRLFSLTRARPNTAAGRLLHSFPAPKPSTALYGANFYGGKFGEARFFHAHAKRQPRQRQDLGGATVLHNFGDSSVKNDGRLPCSGNLLLDSAGDLIGATFSGGANDQGTVFSIAPDATTTILHDFSTDSNPGSGPFGGLILGSDGNYYGTTAFSGANDTGIVYRLTPGGDLTDLDDFPDNNVNGFAPYTAVLEDSDGNLLGTAQAGGTGNNGVVFKLATTLPNPVKLRSVTISPASVVGGQANATGTITLGKPAPSGGAKVTLTTSNSSAAAVPSSVTVPANSETAKFTVTSEAVTASATVTITAAYNKVSKTVTLTVTPPPAPTGLKSVMLSPASAEGGSAPTTANRVYWNGNAPASEMVTLKSSNTAVATVPSSVTISSGSSSHMFTITTKAVSSTQSVTITATSGGVTQIATLTVTP